MFEIAPGRFIVASRIVGCNIYTKENVRRVAITMDTVNAEERTVFSAPMESEEAAKTFVANLGSHL